MFKRIWRGWLDGWLDGWRKARIFCRPGMRGLWLIAVPAGLTAAALMVLLSYGVAVAGMRSLHLAGFVTAGVFVYFGMFVPLIGKSGSWWNRSGPGGRRRMRALWRLARKTRYIRWWLEGLYMADKFLRVRGPVAALSPSLLVGLLLVGLVFAEGDYWGRVLYYSSVLVFFTLGLWPLLGALCELGSRMRGIPHLLCYR